MAETRAAATQDPARRALLARLLRDEGVELPAAPLRTAHRPTRDAPLSFAQERLWFLDQFDPGNPVYHIARALRLKGKLERASLDRALDETTRRHEVLRTTFPCIEDRPVQRVAARLTRQPAIIDLRGTPRAQRRAEMLRALAELREERFDLQRGPLIRAHLLQLGARDHVLLLVLHQIICDGWSMNLLLRELAALYGAALLGKATPLPTPAIPYRDYARRQRQDSHKADLKEQLAYWRARLQGSASGIALPTDRARPAQQSFRGARLPLSIPKPLVERLKALGRREGATPFMVFMAAFNALLWRYSGQEDISVGFPAANRDSNTSGAIGLFVNTLVLRTDLSGDPTFRALLRRVRERCRGALAHRDLPFDRLVEEIERERDLSRNPLFQVMFAYRNYTPAQFPAPGLRVTPLDSGGATAKFDLTLALSEHGSRVDGFFEYATDLFERATIERMARHFIALLRGAAARPDRPLAKISLLAKGERRRVLIEWNRAGASGPARRSMHQLFEAQAARAPRAVALECGGKRLTYGELNRRANCLARFLRKRGLGPEKLAAVCLDRSLEMAVALLAVLKSGGAFLPLDPNYPRERIAFMLEDSRASVLLTQEKFLSSKESSVVRSQFSNRRGAIVCLDAERKRIAKESSNNLSNKARSGNLAYVIYTSGSTGEPKGVAIEHRNAAAFLRWTKSVFSPAELAGVAASTSICFDLSIFELFAPWSAGGKVILIDSALALAELARRSDITLINTVPSAMSALLAAGCLPRSVRTVNLAGEPLKAEMVRQIYATGAVEKVYDLYGPTETTTYSTCALRRADGRATIGRPIANTRIYILDAALQPVPIGMPGEIFIGGAGVARGYLRRRQLTAKKFLRDPFAGRAGARMYRTGDRARFHPEGTIEYLGRADDQVKIRGYRIELGEIEAVLARHPAVRVCAVVVRRSKRVVSESGNQKPVLSPVEGSAIENRKSDEHLAAYVVAKEGTLAAAELRDFLRGKLPEFMVPSTFVGLAALPLTANGKVDRRALAASVGEPMDPRARDFVAPRSEIEELIAQTWRAVLKIERIDVLDDFFDLGGHSLLATRVAARLRAALDAELPLRVLFEARTIAALAREIEARRGNRRGIALPKIPRAAPGDRAPLSFAQRRLWFLHKLDPGLTAYNMPAAYRLRGPLSIATLERALDQLVQRHEILRTAIVEIDGEPMQQILAEAQLSLTKIDLTGMPAARTERGIARLANEDAERPYDFGAAPLMRAQILRLADDDHVLLMNFHHMICDGSSLALFYGELAALYEAYLRGQEPLLPAPAVRYADYVLWQQRALREGWLAPQLAYWRRQLGGRLAPLDLPLDGERSAIQTDRGGRVSRGLSGALSEKLKRLARSEQVTLFMILLAALKLLLARLSGENDIVVGSTVAGRNRSELDGLVGFFINALALRSDLSANPRFVELLRRVREVCLEAYTHQDAPFELVVEELGPERDPRLHPVFQVLFNMAEIADRELRLSGCATTRLNRDVFGAKFDLVAGAGKIGGAIELTLTYNADLFAETRAQSMLAQWDHLLAQVADDPGQRLDQFSLVSESAAAVLPDPAAPLDDRWRGPIHAWLARRAREQPRKPAVVDERESWSYRELKRAAARLANRFRAAGVRAKDAVAIYAHRDASLAPALLGVLQAGAVFVILDPSHPPARLVEYLRLAQPAGFLHMEEAGAPPAEIEAYLHAAPVKLRMILPRARRSIARLLVRSRARAQEAKIAAGDPAYIAFTSGSTGEPKGVLGRHGPITHFLPWQRETFDLGSGDRYALLSGLGYNHLHRDLFTALALGATLHVPEAKDLQDARRLARWLGRNKISILHLTPALGRFLQTAPDIVLPALRRVFFGGDRLLRGDVTALLERAPNAKIASFYGATETQRAVGFSIIDEPRRGPGAPTREVLPIGEGAPGVQLLILNAKRHLAGIGEIGELCVRSPHLAAGYVGDGALRENNFIVNPFTGDPRDRLYRAGELGRYLPDGKVEWLGRNERRASIRGFRVELAEVERALGRCPGVRSAAAVGEVADEQWGGETRLIAYVESAPGGAPDAGVLREYLNDHLPGYMVPSAIHFIERMPLNPSGKIDYAALRRAARSSPPRARSFEAPKSATERAVERVFAEVLRLERVGRADNFFALGGHSLLAAKAAARLRETFGVKLDLRAFLEAPTVAEICLRMEASNGAGGLQAQSAGREEIEL
jgi:amino acid adenylation domain-containing protein